MTRKVYQTCCDAPVQTPASHAAHGLLQRLAVALCLARDKVFDIGEVVHIETGNVLVNDAAAVGIDWVDLDPQAVVPVCAS